MNTADAAGNAKRALGEAVHSFELFQQLKQLLLEGKVESKSLNFAKSLCDYYLKNNFWSEKQLFYVKKIITDSTLASAPASAIPAKQIECTEIWKLFDTASQQLKWPTLRYQNAMLGRVVVYCAGERSSMRGSLVFHNGFPYPDRINSASLSREGKLEWLPGVMKSSEPEKRKQWILEIIAEPIKEAKLSGIAFGSCCFCALELTDKRSVSAGYGPICAAKWGLPWGDSPPEASINLEEF